MYVHRHSQDAREADVFPCVILNILHKRREKNQYKENGELRERKKKERVQEKKDDRYNRKGKREGRRREMGRTNHSPLTQTNIIPLTTAFLKLEVDLEGNLGPCKLSQGTTLLGF